MRITWFCPVHGQSGEHLAPDDTVEDEVPYIVARLHPNRDDCARYVQFGYIHDDPFSPTPPAC